MSFADTYEAPLRSYIETRSRTLHKEIERTARNRTKLNAVALEQQIDRESNRFITDVNTRLDGIRDEIKARRPVDRQQPDYANRMKQYQEFVSSASSGVGRVKTWIKDIFDKLYTMIKDIVRWILDDAMSMFNVLGLIADSFGIFSLLFM